MTTLDELRTGGRVRPITRWGTPVMHARTEPVTEFGDDLHALVRDMFATMDRAQGVGLAATQVGVPLAVFVYECADADDTVSCGVVCNPVVELPDGRDRQLESTEEGCLSLPGAYEMLARPDHAICRGVDADGNPVVIQGTGLLARCLQHETDHLSGTVFGDRLSARRRKTLYQAHRDVAYRYLDDWPVSPKQPFDPVLEKD